MTKKIRVRFAPSPTGPLHIGGVRTALFNYLFAKKHGGDFLLRIEDTDQARFVPGAEAYINEALEWLGIAPDEGVKQGGKFGPYKQSERKEIYFRYAQQLLSSGWAYYAFDSPEELEKVRTAFEAEKKNFAYDVNTRKQFKNSLTIGETEAQIKIAQGEPYVIRFKMPENIEIKATDIIRGEVRFNTSTLDDKVIFKSDGLPTYHLANIVDDHLMEITHVIRGEEWLPSLPLHIMLYKALGWENTMPEFAHLPLILKPSGKGKLSKRDGDKEGFPVFPLQWVAEGEIASGYRESGYFPEAVINLLSLLGWNSGTEQEIFNLDELIQQFSLERVNKSGARFDPDKAKWFNQQYLQKKTDAELAVSFAHLLQSKGYQPDNQKLIRIVGMVKERSVFITDLWEQAAYFFEAPKEYDTQAIKKFWKEDTVSILESVGNLLHTTKDFTSALLEESFKTYIENKELGFGKVMNPLRIALVGAAKGPHLFDIIEIIGLEETLHRINQAIDKIKP